MYQSRETATSSLQVSPTSPSFPPHNAPFAYQPAMPANHSISSSSSHSTISLDAFHDIAFEAPSAIPLDSGMLTMGVPSLLDSISVGFPHAASPSLSSQSSMSRSPSLPTLGNSTEGVQPPVLSRTFRARAKNSKEGAPACDFCRKRKVKCDRMQPTCSFCIRHEVECVTEDQLRKRGPPTKAQRIDMMKAGYLYDRRRRRWRKCQSGEQLELEPSEE
ncbi:hypothetical protein CBS101457_005344 [Exobasidium rhododendri]|nr:hypothetical protein CBS101457_005344 [Exobasidium rhododendri]